MTMIHAKVFAEQEMLMNQSIRSAQHSAENAGFILERALQELLMSSPAYYQMALTLTDGPHHPPAEVKSSTETTSPPAEPHNDDPQAQVISSLRSQVSDLFAQVSQLNNKLVQSYERVSDLEDNLHITSSNLRSQSLQISQLELERSQHLAALNTGLLVEKSHVTAELNRLMERATDEAARRGKAETAQADIEQELDDLSANLFNQANTMVAEARLDKARSERRVEEAEAALRSAEEAVSLMQTQMQQLEAEKLQSQKMLENVTGSGHPEHSTERRNASLHLHLERRFLSDTPPFHEFNTFVNYIRRTPFGTSQPTVQTLLSQPFLLRLVTEDTEPTLRLDLAPALNWLTRRAVLAAIQQGQLSIEPMSVNRLLSEYTTSTATTSLSCSLCGTPINTPSLGDTAPPPTHPSSRLAIAASSAWTSSLFKNASYSTPPSTPPATDSRPPVTNIHIFRLTISSNQGSSSALPSKAFAPHPLCASGWCLTRLRTTCSLWAFVRSNVIEHVWDERRPGTATPKDILPPTPPRRKMSDKVTSLWGTGFSVLSKEKESSKIAGTQTPPLEEPNQKESLSSTNVDQKIPRRLPPPLPRRSEVRETKPNPESQETSSASKPLPSATNPETAAPPVSPGSSNAAAIPVKSQSMLLPSEIPLPDSMPPSPTGKLRPLSGIIAATDAKPTSRPSSPTPNILRSGSPAPPPIPRRAAGRRPVPAPPTAHVHPSHLAEEVKGSSADSPASSDAIVAASAAVDKDASAENAPAAVETSLVQANEAVVPSDSSLTAPEPLSRVVSNESTYSEARAPSPPVKNTTSRSNSWEHVDPPPPPPRHPIEPPPPPPRRHEPDSKAPVTYLSNDTWEERTYIQILKLKEDMFWARTGANS
ncbi:hypothetical protein SISNIDRAFT_513466 [Sistotremastrum niveocremeum HHB9708]|uniref:GDP/GTP exchange factor Sec2 N-terminal domain-containing protein n=1 Tax=Sistotremastrum niveocremeum HHB9708 TaxID=1314777 RepID=A0A164ZZ13_9AGAM|nr:hypothetical protein SISNIDRAFT_513466 [Sistotremastrum niveocremeum HHB9708]